MALFSDQSRNYIVTGLIVLVVVLSAVLIYLQYSTLSSLQAEVEEEELAVDLAQARLNQLINHRNNAPKYAQRLAYAQNRIPSEAAEEEIISYIYRLVEDSDMRAIEIRFDGRSPAENFTAIPISLTLEGSYEGSGRLLRQMRNGDRIFRVDNLRVSRGDDAGSALRFVISTNAFYNQND